MTRRGQWSLLLGAGLLCAGCHVLPAFEPGVTRRADVLLELGEPLFDSGDGRELIYALRSGAIHVMQARETCYRERGDGVRVLRDPTVNLSSALMDGPVAYEFDGHGRLVRRLP